MLTSCRRRCRAPSRACDRSRPRRPSSGRCAARLDDGGAALLHGRDERSSYHFAVHQRCAGLPSTVQKLQVRVLRRGVVAPDRASCGCWSTWLPVFSASCDKRAVVIEARHGGEIARIQVLRVRARDHRVGVRGVADHQHADVAIRDFVHAPCPAAEKICAFAMQQILALHAGAARARADQQRGLAVLDTPHRYIRSNDYLHDAKTPDSFDYHHNTKLLSSTSITSANPLHTKYQPNILTKQHKRQIHHHNITTNTSNSNITPLHQPLHYPSCRASTTPQIPVTIGTTPPYSSAIITLQPSNITSDDSFLPHFMPT